MIGAEFGRLLRLLLPGLLLLDRLRTVALDDDLVWVLPRDVLPVAAGDPTARLYGYPVLHADVPAPLLAHRLPTPPKETLT